MVLDPGVEVDEVEGVSEVGDLGWRIGARNQQTVPAPTTALSKTHVDLDDARQVERNVGRVEEKEEDDEQALLQRVGPQRKEVVGDEYADRPEADPAAEVGRRQTSQLAGCASRDGQEGRRTRSRCR